MPPTPPLPPDPPEDAPMAVVGLVVAEPFAPRVFCQFQPVPPPPPDAINKLFPAFFQTKLPPPPAPAVIPVFPFCATSILIVSPGVTAKSPSIDAPNPPGKFVL